MTLGMCLELHIVQIFRFLVLDSWVSVGFRMQTLYEQRLFFWTKSCLFPRTLAQNISEACWSTVVMVFWGSFWLAELINAGECSVLRREAVRETGECSGKVGRPLEAMRRGAPTVPLHSVWLDSEPLCQVSADMATWLCLGPRQGTGGYQNTQFPLSKHFFHLT